MSKSIVGLLCAGSVLIAVLLTGCSFLQSSHRQSPEAETVIPVAKTVPSPTSTAEPTVALLPTNTSTPQPTATPTSTPSYTPTPQPTVTPTSTPTYTPTLAPTATPTSTPTSTPSPIFPILGVFRLKGQSKRDSGIIFRSCKAIQSPVYPIRDAILAVNHASVLVLFVVFGPPANGVKAH